MKLLVALGNSEPEYSWTRHNAGKEILNLFAQKQTGLTESVQWQRYSDDIEYIDASNYKLLKPKGYMNVLGEPIYSFVRFYKIQPANILIIYDELDMVVGTYKLTKGRGSNIHNGLKSVEQYLDSEQLWHLRVGVREPEIEMSVQKAGKDPSRYVLQKLPISHKKQVVKLYEDAINKVLIEWLSKDL